MTILLALVALILGFFIWRQLSCSFGAAASFVPLLLLIIVVIDFAVPAGPFGWDSETLMFGPLLAGDAEHMGAILLAFFVGIPLILGAVVGVFSGLTKRERRRQAAMSMAAPE